MTIQTSDRAAHPPNHIGVLLYPGFEALDLFGPLEFFNVLSCTETLKLSLISTGDNLDPVSTRAKPTPGDLHVPSIGQSLTPTHTLATAPADLDVLLIPGARESSVPVNNPRVLEFVRHQAAKVSALAAAAGALDGKRATSNKNAWTWVTAQSAKVDWQPCARWVADGTDTWTSSGVSAGMDMTVAFIKQVWGAEVAKTVAKVVEYTPIEDPDNDPFAVQLA
ncbi:hypothetical protein RI367_002401 [Sorochytrium milnesiophthora]